MCGGKKDKNNKWNINGHKDRIVYYNEERLRVIADALEEGADWNSVKLPSIYVQEVVDVLEKFSFFKTHLSNYNCIISEGLHEVGSVDKGIMKRFTSYPQLDKYEMIYSGPHFYVGNPFYKSPRKECILNSDYDTVNTTSISDNFIPRTNYIPININEEYKHQVKGFYIKQSPDGTPEYDSWIDYYKMGFRRMIGSDSERTLSGAILLPKTMHIGGVVSVTFKSYWHLCEFASLSSSIPLDFYVKTLKITDIHANRLLPFPMGIDNKYKVALYSRILQLNCLTMAYFDLWQSCWRPEYAQEEWSLSDPRLKPFTGLTEEWTWDTPLRNYFERRQALVEIDVLAAMALGLSLKDLELIYTIQFPVLQQNENDTWYDAKGNIVFTCSSGLKGVGCERKEWEAIRGSLSEDGMTCEGTAPTYVHTIDPKKSEMYGGEEVTYYAPYNKCDRIADYRRAWAFFENRL